jgi:hypothetical protein
MQLTRESKIAISLTGECKNNHLFEHFSDGIPTTEGDFSDDILTARGDGLFMMIF